MSWQPRGASILHVGRGPTCQSGGHLDGVLRLYVWRLGNPWVQRTCQVGGAGIAVLTISIKYTEYGSESLSIRQFQGKRGASPEPTLEREGRKGNVRNRAGRVPECEPTPFPVVGLVTKRFPPGLVESVTLHPHPPPQMRCDNLAFSPFLPAQCSSPRLLPVCRLFAAE